MTDLRWVLVALALVACGGRSVGDGPAAAGGESAGGSTSFAGASSGGASSMGGASSGGSATCLSGAKPPASPTTFSFESNAALWIRSTCGLDYILTKACTPGSVAIPTASPCSQPCNSGDSGCSTCGACPSGALQLGQFGPDGPNVAAIWDGYAYIAGTSNSGCACFDRVPAGSGTYTIEVAGYRSAEDALMQQNSYLFNTTFEYPPPDGIVHIRLDFMGL